MVPRRPRRQHRPHQAVLRNARAEDGRNLQGTAGEREREEAALRMAGTPSSTQLESALTPVAKPLQAEANADARTTNRCDGRVFGPGDDRAWRDRGQSRRR